MTDGRGHAACAQVVSNLPFASTTFAFESAGSMLNRVHYIFVDIQRRPRPQPSRPFTPEEFQNLRLCPSLQKRISGRIIAADRFSAAHKGPRAPPSRAIPRHFPQSDLSSFVGITGPSSSPCREGGLDRDGAGCICGIVEELATPDFSR